MEKLSTRTHGYMDYAVGLLIAASPKIFGFDKKGAQSYLPLILGTGAIIYSLFTKYEMGKFRTLPMKIHLLLDEISGTLLAASPWLFNFQKKVKWPHLVFGLLELGTALITKSKVERGRLNY
jgi:hypothetical protein